MNDSSRAKGIIQAILLEQGVTDVETLFVRTDQGDLDLIGTRGVGKGAVVHMVEISLSNSRSAQTPDALVDLIRGAARQLARLFAPPKPRMFGPYRWVARSRVWGEAP